MSMQTFANDLTFNYMTYDPEHVNSTLAPILDSPESGTEEVCHHGECQQKNGEQPIMLCDTCDQSIHAEPQYNTHLRFELYRKGKLNRNSSLRSLPDGLSHSEDEEDTSGQQQNSEMAKGAQSKRKRILGKKRTEAECGERVTSSLRYRDDSLSQELASDDDDSYDDDDPRVATALQNGSGDRLAAPPAARDVMHQDNNDVNKHEQVSSAGAHYDDFAQRNAPDQSNGSLQLNQNKGSSFSEEDGSEEAYAGVIQSSPSFKRPIPHQVDDEVGSLMESKDLVEELDDTAGVDGTGQSRSYQVQSPSAANENEDNKQLSHRKAEVPGNKQTTTPTTPKTPPGMPEMLKKYSMDGEYFTLKLDVLGENDVYEIVAAEKGVSLRDAVRGCLERRGINVNNINVYLASSNTPLPLIADCYMLGGNHLHVKAKDSSDSAPLPTGRSSRSQSTTSLTSNTKQKEKVTKQMPVSH